MPTTRKQATTKTAAKKAPAAKKRPATRAAASKAAANGVFAARGTGESGSSSRHGRRDLVIVESPAKARTIAGILGPNYEVTASVGHVRDLPKSKLGVDI